MEGKANSNELKLRKANVNPIYQRINNLKSQKTMTDSIVLRTLIFIVSILIVFVCLLFALKDEFRAYSNETYAYLDSVADEVIEEGSGLNLALLPDEINTFYLNKDSKLNPESTFVFELVEPKMILTIQPQVKVTFDSEFKEISREFTYNSEQEYQDDALGILILISLILGSFFACLFLVVRTLIIFLIQVISKAINKRNQNA